MAPVIYPPPGTPNVFLNPRWIAVPVMTPDSLANCYINGTGVVDFSGDPELPLDAEWAVDFQLAFTDDSPLEPDDVVDANSVMVTVGFSQINSDEGGDWILELFETSVQNVVRTTTDLTLVVKAGYAGDGWIDRLAYEIDLLIYRPRFNSPQPQHFPWTVPIGEVARVAREQLFRPGRVR